jgi:hypothetical protein
MRVHAIACAAILTAAVAGCSSELAERPAASDPSNVTATEAPYRAPPAYQSDPLLSPVPPNGSELPPTGSEQVHSPTATPPGNPPMREEPGGHVPAHPPGHAPLYTCPMHPEVQAPKPGECPKCGMTLVPKAGER